MPNRDRFDHCCDVESAVCQPSVADDPGHGGRVGGSGPDGRPGSPGGRPQGDTQTSQLQLHLPGHHSSAPELLIYPATDLLLIYSSPLLQNDYHAFHFYPAP